MTPECSLKDLADAIQLRSTQEAGLLSSSMIQSISSTLADVTRNLYEVLNSRQPLFKLPNEVLTRIVGNMSSWPLDEVSEPDKKPIWRSTAQDTIVVLPVTHTCHRLRQIIVADTTHWRHMTTVNRNLIELSLSRSGSTKSFTMSLSPREVPGLPPRILALTDFHHQLAPRLRELHFHNCVPKNFPGVRQFLELPFPNLDSFSWTGEMSIWEWSGWEDDMLPSSGFSGTASCLRYLHIQQMRMLLPASNLPHLTHLCISSITSSNIPMLIGNVLQCCPALTTLILRKFSSLGSFDDEATWEAQPLHLPRLSRVILADMDFIAIRYFMRLLAGHAPCMQVVLTDQADSTGAYQGELFASLYLQYWRPDHATDPSRLSVAAHAVEGYTDSGLFVTLANSTHLLRVTMSPWAARSVLFRKTGRKSILTPLRALPDLHEVVLTDMHTDTFMPADSLPFGNALATNGDANNAPSPGFGTGSNQAQVPTPPPLESVVLVFNCSVCDCEHSRAIHPTLAALSKSPLVASNSNSNSDSGLSAAAPLPLTHLRLAIGYDAADLPCLREAWESAGGQGQVGLSAKLLPELVSGEYVYVRHAALVVQLMPHLALDAGELARLCDHFAEVDVEEIDRLPTIPVPDCVRDDAMAPGGFVEESVLY